MPTRPAATRPLSARGHASTAALRLTLAVAGCLFPASMAWASPPTPGLAAPDDDWSLERRTDDPRLVEQRFAKLRKNPFDGVQWRALVQATGLERLTRRIEAQRERQPEDLSLAILEARARWQRGDPRGAATMLEQLQSRSGRWEKAVLDMRVDALVAAGRPADAAFALEAAASTGRDSERLLQRALGLAERGPNPGDALRIARRLVELRPEDGDARLRLGRAAAAAGDYELADAALRAAADRVRPRARAAIAAERARVLLRRPDPGGAATLLWQVLSRPDAGSRSEREDWWALLLDAHVREGSSDALVARLRTWLSQSAHEREAAAWKTLARAEQVVGSDATPTLRRALATSPRDADTHAALIETLEAAGRIDEAVAEAKALVERSPDEAHVAIDFANRLVASGSRERALALAAEFERGAGRRTRTLLLLLDFYNLNDEPELALTVARRLAQSHPRDPDVRVALGEQLYQMNRSEDALQQWSMIPDLIRPRHRGLARHAEVLSEHERTGEAIVALKGALAVAPEEPNYLRLMAVLQEQLQRPERALGFWKEVRRLAHRPEQRVLRDEARTRIVELLVNGSGVGHRGRTLQVEIAEASRMLDAGEPVDEAIEAGRFLAELYTRQESYEAAVGIQIRLLGLAPEDGDRVAELAAAHRRAGHTREAIRRLEELLAIDASRSAEVLADLSELAYEAGEADRALETATKAVREDRNQIDALIHLGELHERHGDLQQAARAYERALSTAPTDPRARLRLAELTLTRGDVDQSARMFRTILDGGGPPELMREAGRRALDLAEATNSTVELLVLAVDRARVDPTSEQPQDFLLEALDRASREDVEQWLKDGTPSRRTERVAALRRPLVASLSRGSVGARVRAADHLGSLGLPETAVPLATMGAQLTPPRDATRTVRDLFEQARVTALKAAGELDDPTAVEVFAAILKDTRQTSSVRHAAAWALARNTSEQAVLHLAPFVYEGADPLLAALACVAVAEHGARPVEPGLASRITSLARESNDRSVRHACTLAEAALIADHEPQLLLTSLASDDPIRSAIFAWRISASERPFSDAILEALFRRFIGPHGLARDAAGAALATMLAGGRKPAAPPLPFVHGSGWAIVLDRWLTGRLAPRYPAISVSALGPHRDQVRAALMAARQGTRAERDAARRALSGCGVSQPPLATGDLVCLQPLLRSPFRLSPPFSAD